MTGESYKPYNTHLGRDIDPLRKRTEVLVHLLVDGDIRVPQHERIEPGRRFQAPDRTLLFRQQDPRHIILRDLLGELTAELTGRLALRFTCRRLGPAFRITAQDDARVPFRQRGFYTVDCATAERRDEPFGGSREPLDGARTQRLRGG